MDFKNDLDLLRPPSCIQFTIPGVKFPTNQDVFFRAKQREIVDQYASARVMMYEIESKDWNHWLTPKENMSQAALSAYKAQYCALFFESALFFYNAVVDLSWTLCYICAEFSLHHNGQRVDFLGLTTIDEAAELLRTAERNVTAPTAETNPFGYLKKMCPEFTSAIDLIVKFWEEFSNSEIRNKYNYCKHKGKPLYTEVAPVDSRKLIDLHYVQHGETFDLPSAARDVQWTFSLYDSIAELKRFDDEALFPYLLSLITELEQEIQPSPMVP